MKLECFGAAGEVTGSCHLLTVGERRFLLDCGLYQGDDGALRRNHEPFPFTPSAVDAVLLSHAHLDHCGRLPLLVKRGFNGPIYAHRATRELCRVLLEDAVAHQQWEEMSGDREDPDDSYDRDDVARTLERFRVVDYGVSVNVAPELAVRFLDAGHILGSAIVDLTLHHRGRRRRVVFSGDLGHRGAPLLPDPTAVSGPVDLVLMESTYGDRLHRPWDESCAHLDRVLEQAAYDGGNVLVPAFAVGRTQLLLELFADHYRDWELARWQMYLDSPMAIAASAVYVRHPELFQGAAATRWQRADVTGLLPQLHLTPEPRQSMAINGIKSGALIIAGGGMCEGGRIYHHFKHHLGGRNNHVLVVGFQAPGTLGHRLLNGDKSIEVWGETLKVRAHVHDIAGLSAHADQNGLLDWYGAIPNRPPVALVHGQREARHALETQLKCCFGVTALAPEFGSAVML